MKYRDLFFEDFLNSNSYCNLLKYFGSFDEQSRYEALSAPIDDFEILFFERDELSGIENYSTKYLEKDFLLPSISKLADNHILKFRRSIFEKGLFSKDQLEGFAKHTHNYIAEVKKSIRENNFLKIDIQLALLKELFHLEGFLENYWNDPYPNVAKKMKFKWNRTDVEYFFFLLRENKVIEWIEDSDLGRIIDNMCEYCTDKSNKKYVEINLSRKHLNAWKNNEGRPDKDAINRLKKVFSNPDYYNV